MPKVNLRRVAQKIMIAGPTRVVIDQEGTGVTCQRAKKLGVKPQIIFIRDDGWSIGCRREHEDVTESLWTERWIGVIIAPSSEAQPYIPKDKKDG